MYISSILIQGNEYNPQSYFLPDILSKSHFSSTSSQSDDNYESVLFPPLTYSLSVLPLTLPVCLAMILRASFVSELIETVFSLISEHPLPAAFLRAFLSRGMSVLGRSVDHQRAQPSEKEPEVDDLTQDDEDEDALASSHCTHLNSQTTTAAAVAAASTSASSSSFPKTPSASTSISHTPSQRFCAPITATVRTFSLFIQNILTQHPLLLIPPRHPAAQLFLPSHAALSPSKDSKCYAPLDENDYEAWVAVRAGDWFFDEGMSLQLEHFALHVAEFDGTRLYQMLKSRTVTTHPAD